MDTEIIKYTALQREQIIEVWERSVRATHKFVSVEDIEYFKKIVKNIDFSSFEVYCLILNKKVLGFVGVADRSIEMLFLDPDFIGQGYGKKLISFAIDKLNAAGVTVNEQNELAVAFYKKNGFLTYERMEKDEEGKNYPILKMKLPEKESQLTIDTQN